MNIKIEKVWSLMELEAKWAVNMEAISASVLLTEPSRLKSDD